jgi:hypothetical protein
VINVQQNALLGVSLVVVNIQTNVAVLACPLTPQTVRLARRRRPAQWPRASQQHPQGASSDSAAPLPAAVEGSAQAVHAVAAASGGAGGAAAWAWQQVGGRWAAAKR